ncbi:MAG: M20/M25/M40 family metallo-hydrolase [Candidatus Eisenbacteria bacterium]|uniref:M20/M25/M40 family metallo-hydrolase n=1 Tax=Eiseniibacteriota bacterium TaxID=2212470 RepID=A0A933W8L9_UNCEI|nr:M20/M25/M40 family metallo-hydrolase [Candidatus Eisenbacteria bacterium]
MTLRRVAFALLTALAQPGAAAASTATTAPAPADAHVHHAMHVTLDPPRGWLEVTDTLTVPAAFVKDGSADFLLHGALVLNSSTPPASRVPLRSGSHDDATRFFGINASDADLDTSLARWRVTLPPAGGSVVLHYAGHFDFGLSDEREQYTRGFRQTIGIVSKEGVYLAGDGFWYPQLNRGLMGARVSVSMPDGWQVIAPGNGRARDSDGQARWNVEGGLDELTLVGGPLLEYREKAGAIDALVYLRTKDDALAAKYLEATAQYLKMYEDLIGPYPYGKFAMVENFWETGYGMPSYTLLGPQIIRFPFILTSSYPHEILHNWWGNSVFVDYESGNWCEGLTAYMADHLIQEQRGRGAEYRRDALQKYRNYVRDGRDLALSAFRSRHSAATEAVGYGKALMVFHMLRQRVGDDAFRRWVRTFDERFRGKQASWADVESVFESVSGLDLTRFFADHVTRVGAAELRPERVQVRASADGFEITGTLVQAQKGAALELHVPVLVQTAKGNVTDTVHCFTARTAFTVRTKTRPLALPVDPAADVFRLLDPRETPPSLGQVFGDARVLAVLPAKASATEQAAWRTMAESWRSDGHAIEFATDAEVKTLPADRAVWLLGRGNTLAASRFAGGADFALTRDTLRVDGEAMAMTGHCGVLVRRHPGAVEKAMGWIFADDMAALPGLGRKLPHYGKYSALGFEGTEPVNVLKAQWSATDSPLRVALQASAPQLPPLTHPALAELPPVFSEQAMLDRVRWLAAPEREGRGVGTKGLDESAEWIAARMREFGLEPGGDNGTYFQAFTTTKSPNGQSVTLRNVIGVLRGAAPERAGQAALLTAHYDHLGRGWPDVHAGDAGKVHAGADDNASGVAVMLELARALAAGEKPQRTIAFIAFTGEESGLQGSRHYVAHPAFALDKTIGVINLDTVGRLFGKRVSVLATGTATEWQHIFRGAGFVTGVEPRLVAEALESSDQVSFIEKGVPAVQIFTEPHVDYHRPSDTPEKLDGPGLVKVAAFVREGIQYLGDRPEMLTNTIAGAKPSAPAGGAAAGGGRRVTIGTMPDFAFAGPGVKVAGVTPGSPADKAGLKEGDVLMKLNGEAIPDLKSYSAMLRALQPGQSVRIGYRRGDTEQEVTLTVVER